MSAVVALLFIGAAAVVLLWPAGRRPPLLSPTTPARVLMLRGWLRHRPRGKVIETGVVVLTVAVLAAIAAGLVAALFAAVCAAITTSALGAKRAAGVASARRSAELEILAALAAELRSGRHPAAALNAIRTSVGTPADDDLEAALSAARATATLGGDVSASLRRSGASGALSKLAAAWQLSEECGAPLADLVAQVARDVRAIVELHRAAHVELTGARATGLVLAVLPLLGVALGAAMGAHPLQVLFHTPAGAVCAIGGLTFELAGLAWVRRLTNGTRSCRQ